MPAYGMNLGCTAHTVDMIWRFTSLLKWQEGIAMALQVLLEALLKHYFLSQSECYRH